MNFEFSPSPFPMQQINEENDQYHQHFGPNPSSPSSLSCHIFFNSAQDHTRYYYENHQLYQPLQNSGDNYGYQGGSTYETNNKIDGGLKLTLWKKEDQDGRGNLGNKSKPFKWMSSKMRLMQKMKKADRVNFKTTTTTIALLEDQKVQPSSSIETDLSSNNSSYNNSLIRVCADCNTTKTPLWRSGPKGPKSLCNACGIRKRKARRAMAAAANGTAVSTANQPAAMKIKVQHKGKRIGKNGHASQLKKPSKTAIDATSAVGSPSYIQKKLSFEDFLINLSKNLAFHRVFPEDEKDAAILLMALSSGLVNS